MTHFTALVVYAFFASIVFGITQRSSPREMMRFGASCFAGFVIGAIVVSWGMYLLKH